MSQFQPLVDITLAIFQLSAEQAAAAFGVREVSTYSHAGQDRPVRYYCRYQLPGRELVQESPAARTPNAAVRALRAALANLLGPAPSCN